MNSVRPLLDPDGANLTLIVGAPRSGTTWIGKIFDSHPNVLYRNEPDIVSPTKTIPRFCPSDQIDLYRAAARDYLAFLSGVRAIRAANGRPLFPKTFRSPSRAALRNGLYFALRAGQKLHRNLPYRLTLPDLIDRADTPPHIVIKSVRALGRAGLFAAAARECRLVCVLRHPCGQVASHLHVFLGGYYPEPVRYEQVFQTKEAAEYGLTHAAFARLSIVEKAAWNWAIVNQKALNDLGGNDRALVLRYEDLCADPLAYGRKMMAFAGLSWETRTARFLETSTTAPDTTNHFQIERDSLIAAHRWRQTLSAADQATVLRITSQFPVGRLFDEADA